ncbi:MAG TPA: response regulator [Planctomycetota bacterium]|nr:response regulator [Planctomycetota bacterium]
MKDIITGPILAVEDNPDDLFLLESAIEKAELKGEVRIVRDGIEAIEYLEGLGCYADRNRFPIPSLVLLDLNLPKRSGMGVLEWMRGRPEIERIPVIVLSASSSDTDVRSAYDLGAISYHVKSLSVDELIALMHDIHVYRTSLADCVFEPTIFLSGATPRPVA